MVICLQGLAMLPELNTLRRISVPASAGGAFAAAASSPSALRPQVRGATIAAALLASHAESAQHVQTHCLVKRILTVYMTYPDGCGHPYTCLE